MLCVVVCPHCQDFVIIEELNCAIFRHGILKSTFQQLDPHLCQSMCEYYAKNNLIYGCGKPFQVCRSNGLFKAEPCEYK